jgi:ubiquinone/menaquinone biosynthesis C-methylase UbiE
MGRARGGMGPYATLPDALNPAKSLAFRIVWRATNEAVRFRGRTAINGRLERPDRRQAFSRWVDVRGWAIAESGDPLALRITVNGRHLKTITATEERADVNAAAHGLAKAPGPVWGFDDVVPLDELKTPAYAILAASAVSTRNPSIARTVGVALLRRQSARDRAVPRHAYQQTWDSVSRSVSDARYSVAGTADEAELDRSGQSSALDIARETGLTSSDRVLEIGCGVARIGQRMAALCREWVGADVSVNMLRHAKAACAAVSVNNVDFFHLNGSDLTGIPDASFDVVYCTAVFMHLEEWDRYRYVREAWRVLKPGGRIYFDNVSLISDEGWRQFDALVRYDPAARPPNISKASTPEELRTYAMRAGFTDIKVRPGLIFITVTATKPA